MAKRKKYVPPHTTLTDLEKLLLEYPPTNGTWLCQNVYYVEKNQEVVSIRCKMINSKRYDKCSICGWVRPEEPEYLWPLYVDACNKVGLPPGKFLWRESQNTGRPMFKERGSPKKWKEWEPPEAPVESKTKVENGKVRTRTRKVQRRSKS